MSSSQQLPIEPNPEPSAADEQVVPEDNPGREDGEVTDEERAPEAQSGPATGSGHISGQNPFPAQSPTSSLTPAPEETGDLSSDDVGPDPAWRSASTLKDIGYFTLPPF
jgi:hypothetical protein